MVCAQAVRAACSRGRTAHHDRHRAGEQQPGAAMGYSQHGLGRTVRASLEPTLEWPLGARSICRSGAPDAGCAAAANPGFAVVLAAQGKILSEYILYMAHEPAATR